MYVFKCKRDKSLRVVVKAFEDGEILFMVIGGLFLFGCNGEEDQDHKIVRYWIL